MKTSISKDGTIRTNLTVSFRLSLEDFVVLFISARASTVVNLKGLIKLASAKKKTALIEDIKDQLRSDGQLHSAYRVLDNYSEEWVIELSKLFAKRFPELLPTEAQQKAITKFGLKGSGIQSQAASLTERGQ